MWAFRARQNGDLRNAPFRVRDAVGAASPGSDLENTTSHWSGNADRPQRGRRTGCGQRGGVVCRTLLPDPKNSIPPWPSTAVQLDGDVDACERCWVAGVAGDGDWPVRIGNGRLISRRCDGRGGGRERRGATAEGKVVEKSVG